MIEILRPGAQITLQGAALNGWRHLGFPACGPADPLSMALANFLVGQAPTKTAIEITYGGASLTFTRPMQFALVGALATFLLNEIEVPANETLHAKAGDVLEISPVTAGARIYLAIAGDLDADKYVTTSSTYMPAGLGGFKGRQLRSGDIISGKVGPPVSSLSLPKAARFALSTSFALRASDGLDLQSDDRAALYGISFVVSRRANRMGIGLQGTFPIGSASTALPSSAVFPGTLQVPSGEEAFLLCADGQTTGGYPHLLQVNRSDRHLIGQLRPGDRLQFLRRTPDQAAQDLRSKQAYFSQFLTGFEF